MLRANNLPNRLANILAARGKTANFLVDCIIVDEVDGKPPRLDYWDTHKLGAIPTQDEVDAASDAPSKEQVNAPIVAQLAALDAKMLRALEEGDATRIASRKAEREALRAQLVK